MREDFTNANYSTIADFLAAVELRCLNDANKHYWDQFVTENRRGDDWYGAGCDTGRDVIRMMRDGWPAGRERMNELRSQVSEVELVPQDRRRRMVRADSGDALDIHSVYAGRCDIAWSTPRRMNTRGPQQIDVCANMICSGAAHSDVLFYRGAAAATLSDLLESAGYMVRLVVNFGGNAEHTKTSCRIIVKDHGAPFDVTSTSAVILPGFFRALGHAWIQNHAPHCRDMRGIYVGTGLVEPGELLVSHQVRDHATALAFVNDTIAKINAGTPLAA